MDFNGLEFLVVGAGLSGLTVARKLADAGRKVAIVEKRGERGGLCSAYIDQATGIEVHRHGTHVLHCSNQKVIAFLSGFCQLNHYRHRVFAFYRKQTYSLPINLATINQFFGVDLNPKRAGALLKIMAAQSAERVEYLEDRRRLPIPQSPQNFEEAVIVKMGRGLYEAFIEGYSRKHWGVDPKLLPVRLAERILVRTNFNADYFTDSWQGLPLGGYEQLFSRLSRGISCSLGVDFARRGFVCPPGCKVIYTGALDAYFDFRFGPLSWRGIEVSTETHGLGDYQGTAVVNFPEESVPQTRIHEFKHLRPESQGSSRKTVLSAEFASSNGEPAYPADPEGKLVRLYWEAAALEPDVYFLGRLARYKYLDMDEAVAEALELAGELCMT